jgi:hypothetical protein
MNADLAGTHISARRAIAIKGVKRVIKLHKEDISVLYGMAEQATAKGEYSLAVTHYEAIRRLSETISMIEEVLDFAGV